MGLDEPARSPISSIDLLALRSTSGTLCPAVRTHAAREASDRFRRRAFRATSPAPMAAITQVDGSGTIASRPEAGLKTRYWPLLVSGVYQLPLALCWNVIPE